MADVFVSYAQKWGASAEALVKGLEDRGYDVWWDKGLTPGKNFNETILEQLREAGAVIVVWSEGSVSSQYVQMEAGIAFGWNKLVTVRESDLTADQIPAPFRNFQACVATDLAQIVKALDEKEVPRTSAPSSRRYPTLEQFYASIEKHDPSLPRKLKEWLTKCQSVGLRIDLKSTLMIKDPLSNSRSINFATLTSDNKVYMDYVAWQTEKVGAREVGIAYLTGVASLVEHATVRPTVGIEIFGRPISISKLLERGDDWLKEILDARHDIQSWLDEHNQDTRQ